MPEVEEAFGVGAIVGRFAGEAGGGEKILGGGAALSLDHVQAGAMTEDCAAMCEP